MYSKKKYFHYFILVLILFSFIFFTGCPNPFKNTDFSSFTISQYSSTKTIISWVLPSEATGVLIVRGDSSISWKPDNKKEYAVDEEVASGINVVYNGNNTEYIDVGLTTGQKYYYKIFVYNGDFVYSEGIDKDLTLSKRVYLYIAGTIVDGIHKTAAYWRDGEKHLIGEGLYLSFARAIDVTKDGDVYVAGYYKKDNGDIVPCYWINDEKHDINIGFPSEMESFVITDILVDEDDNNKVYIAGYFKYQTTGYVSGFYWTDSVFNEFNYSSANYNYIYDIFKYDNSIYLAGSYYSTTSYGAYWIDNDISNPTINNSNPDLTISTSTRLTSIFKYGSDLYLDGYSGTSSNVYWINGSSQTLNTANSSVLSTIVYVELDKVYNAGKFYSSSPEITGIDYWIDSEEHTVETQLQCISQGLKVLSGNLYIGGTFLQAGESESNLWYFKSTDNTVVTIEDKVEINDPSSTPDHEEDVIKYYNIIDISYE